RTSPWTRSVGLTLFACERFCKGSRDLLCPFVTVRCGSAALVVLALVVGACSSAPQEQVDVSPIIQPVTQKLADLSIVVKNIDCPPNIAKAPGTTFTCTVTTDQGARFAVNVTQKEDGGQLKLAWEAGRDLLISDRHLADLTAYARTVSPDLVVSCPRAIVL